MADALSFAARHLEPFVSEINALNVFPVPDGDTGTNMFLTLQAAAQAAQHRLPGESPSVRDVLRAASRGALMGARGNSGVILYQIIEGLAQAIPDTEEMDGAGLARGLRRATELAYQAVINPVEGTMLTVIRAATEAAEAAGTAETDVDRVLTVALHGAQEALEQTPDMLPVLRQAGVVDAGGKGLTLILDGMRRFTLGLQPAAPAGEPIADVASAMTFLDQVELVHGVDEFGYCTNFLLTGTHLKVDRIRARMNEVGTSAVVVGSDQTVKVHVHGEHPGTILEAALEFGELEDVRIDNMAAQTRKLLADRSTQAGHDRHEAPVPIAVVAVASGKGLAAALVGMGANVIVDGGPTNNPSTEQILRAVERAPSDTVVILPNDSNVISSARNVAKLTEKTVRVVPSTTVPQGISALSAFNLGLHLDANVKAMNEALHIVTTVTVTRASREAHIEGVHARQGDFIALINGRMSVAGDDVVQITLRAIETLQMDEAELITIFAGQPAGRDVVDQIAAKLMNRYPEVTVEVADGGQPHYDLILAVE